MSWRPKTTPEQREAIAADWRRGIKAADIADRHGLNSGAAVSRIIGQMRRKDPTLEKRCTVWNGKRDQHETGERIPAVVRFTHRGSPCTIYADTIEEAERLRDGMLYGPPEPEPEKPRLVCKTPIHERFALRVRHLTTYGDRR